MPPPINPPAHARVDDPGTWRPRIGQRVAVRRRLAAGGLTDVVGDLLEVSVVATGAVLRVQSRQGAVDVALDDVVAGRVVPPRPVRAAPPHRALALGDLEAVMALHWRALERGHLGTWHLRASQGFTNRANSALPLGDPGCELDAALARVADWYTGRGLPPRISLAAPVDGGPSGDDPLAAVRAVAEEAGWALLDGAGALVLTAATGALVHGPALPADTELRLDQDPDEAWLAAYRYRGRPSPAAAVPLLRSAPQQVFASVRAGGRTVAVARGSLGGGWGGLTAVEVDPAHRRRGLARALLASVARWAGDHGARSLYLQVSDSNGPALALYTSAGLAPHHRYDYWTSDPSA